MKLFFVIRDLAFCFFISLIIQSVVASAYVIPSGSMIPTLQVGDGILVEKLSLGVRVPLLGTKLGARSPDRGDIVVFAQPLTDKDLVKRVVAVAGDQVGLSAGALHINGAPQPRAPLGLVNAQDYDEVTHRWYEQGYQGWSESLGHTSFTSLSMSAGANYGPVTVPAGQVFVLGDNRDNSSDSRYWGFVSIQRIRGRATRVLWSMGPDGARWSRFLARLD